MQIPDGITYLRRGSTSLYLNDGIAAEDVLSAVTAEGRVLKEAKKRRIKVVNQWIVKCSRFAKGVGPLRLTARRHRYRNAFYASLELTRRGISTPRAIAYVERRAFGLIWFHAFIYEYLEMHQTVPEYTRNHLNRSGRCQTEAFFRGLADLLDQLEEQGVFHRDMKPPNLLTNDGQHFSLIDLDEVVVDHSLRAEDRFRSHRQLVLGLREDWDTEDINAFLERGVPEGESPAEWIDAVWEAVRNWR